MLFAYTHANTHAHHSSTDSHTYTHTSSHLNSLSLTCSRDLRLRLWREHLGLRSEEVALNTLIEDPACSQTWDFFKETAERNHLAYEKLQYSLKNTVAKAHDSYGKKDLRNWKEAADFLSAECFGHLVPHPHDFLENEELDSTPLAALAHVFL